MAEAPTIAVEPPSLAKLDIDEASLSIHSPHQSGPTSPEREHVDTKLTDHQDPASVVQLEKEPNYVEPQTPKPQPRNRSPYGYSRSHLRSHSATSSLQALPMARTRSLPSVQPSTSFSSFSYSPSHSPVRPSSPLRSPAPTRANPRRSFEDSLPQSSLPSFMDIESIAEDSELDIQPRGGTPILERELQSSPIFNTPSYASNTAHAHTFPRPSSSNGRRRPVSPLQQSQALLPPPLASNNHGSGGTFPSPSTLSASSPAMPLGSKFNESFPAQPPPTASSSSSMPSTPTSVRSRSPSISSLETIPDTPDAEEAAIEAYNIARLKAAADAADAEEAAENERGSRKSGAFGSALVKDKRKRWSVCGAERRGDFEMETIWED